MKFVNKLSAVCLATAVMLSGASFAGTVTTTELNDNYIGADGAKAWDVDYAPNDAAAHYDIHWMQVSKTIDGNQGSLSVTVNTNFVSYNNTSGFSFGDLFLMDAANYQQADACVDSAGNNAFGCNEYTEQTYTASGPVDTVKSSNEWEYAFDLSGSRSNSYANGVNKDGDLREINQSHYEYSINSTKGNRDWQAIMVNDSAVSRVGGGTWNTDIANDLLTMTFDISGTSLMDAAQLALRWQMTCANDIIEVVTNFGPDGTTGSKPIPEPGTIFLMLLAGFGLFASRKKVA